MEPIIFIMLGMLVGFIVGLTGVGGGALMTPLLMSIGIPPALAVGTDLLYALFTKLTGVLIHKKQSTIHWNVVCRLCSGSIPAAIATTFLLKYLSVAEFNYESLMTSTLGFMLVLSSFAILFKKQINRFINQRKSVRQTLDDEPIISTVIVGAILGVVVTLSSIGAGAIGAIALMLLYPRMNTISVIGTDLAHAIPLAAVASLGHVNMGHVDFSMLIYLLMGSIPAVGIGTMLANRISNNILQKLLASLILILGVRYAFS